MKVISMVIMVMGNTLKVQQLVLFLLFMRHKRTKARKGQRLPAHAKNQKHGDQVTQHVSVLSAISIECKCDYDNNPCHESG